MTSNRHPKERFNIQVHMVSVKDHKPGPTVMLNNKSTEWWPNLMFKLLEEKMQSFPSNVVGVLELSKCSY